MIKMAKINYRNEIAPKIIEEARKRIFNSFMEKGYIDNKDSIESIEDDSIAICSSISMKVTGYFIKHNPEQVNTYAPVFSSLLSVLVGMELANEWANGNKEVPENIYDEMIEESPIEILDEYLLEKIGIEYKSEEYNEMASFINKTYIDNWIYIHEEAQKQGIGTQIMFVVDSLMIMLSIGIQIEKKRLGL
jgi:hypothetical protein